MLNGAKKNFGFGCMRLKRLENGEVDFDNFNQMIDLFMKNGFNYFDTAHGYIDYKSETAIRECLVKRYPRESFVLTNKLSEGFFKTEDEILPLFNSQLEACGVDYFDYYLMHAHNAEYFEKYNRLHAYEIVSDLKKQGKVRHMGISFHDTADVLDMILTKRPEIEVVQLQFNYLDLDDERVQAQACYDVCVKHGKDVIVMEPVKGGRLVNLPLAARNVFDRLGGGYAEYAIRFAAGFENVKMVLSGMNDTKQMEENIRFMKDFKPLSDEEMEAVFKVRSILENQDIIQCTACGYCLAGCPMNIPIPSVFELLNKKKLDSSFDFDGEYSKLCENNGSANDCISCGQCEGVCPQKLEIIKLLEAVK
ncbi:MAG: aldo/keto reductase [Eubacterium sp.]|nr:aldo/keto reductase [Eubacterium sp.]